MHYTWTTLFCLQLRKSFSIEDPTTLSPKTMHHVCCFRWSRRVLSWTVVVWSEFVSLVLCILPPLCRFHAATYHRQLQTRHTGRWLTSVKFWCRVDVHWFNSFLTNQDRPYTSGPEMAFRKYCVLKRIICLLTSCQKNFTQFQRKTHKQSLHNWRPCSYLYHSASSLVNGPDKVEGDLGPSVQTFTNRRLRVVIWVHGDLLATEVNCTHKHKTVN